VLGPLRPSARVVRVLTGAHHGGVKLLEVLIEVIRPIGGLAQADAEEVVADDAIQILLRTSREHTGNM
jgi:hypothetical protein